MINELQAKILEYDGTLAERDFVYNEFFDYMSKSEPDLYAELRLTGRGHEIKGACQDHDREYIFNGFFGCLEGMAPNVYRNGYFGHYENTASKVYKHYHTVLRTVEYDF